jgi:hypothetical protein
MIHFRCWFCNKRYTRAESCAGQRMQCSCERPLRVPRKSNGSSRARTLADWLIEALVYGGGGGLLGLGFGLLIVSQIPWRVLEIAWIVIPPLTVLGFLLGLFGGERAINWLGRLIRDQEDRQR